MNRDTICPYCGSPMTERLAMVFLLKTVTREMICKACHQEFKVVMNVNGKFYPGTTGGEQSRAKVK
jgi:hypothetical protein